MKLANRQILVTGATGFLGSHLVEALVREGCQVRALAHYRSDQSPSGTGNIALLPAEVLDGVELVWGDVCDRDSVTAAMRGIEVVFHLAALIGIPYSYQAPSSYLQVNAGGTLNLLQAARDAGVGRFVHTSTSEVYGTAQYTPIDEKHPLVAQSPYAASKIAADKLAESFHRSFDLAVVTVRPFNAFGPRQTDRAVIPTIISQRLADIDPVVIGNAKSTRDFTFASDTARGFVRAAACDDAVGQTVNLGTGQGITIGELAEVICALTSGGSYRSDTARKRPDKSEVQELLCNADRAAELLDWRASTTLKDGLLATIDFIRTNPDRYRPTLYGV
ncbi:MAG TPA: GDP-mannose 4,6-dehydratase [Phycisphaerae bacterium]|nr:GDP-mannose 4,6-dehydratase [Phycisphaerae bacterium]